MVAKTATTTMAGTKSCILSVAGKQIFVMLFFFFPAQYEKACLEENLAFLYFCRQANMWYKRFRQYGRVADSSQPRKGKDGNGLREVPGEC